MTVPFVACVQRQDRERVAVGVDVVDEDVRVAGRSLGGVDLVVDRDGRIVPVQVGGGGLRQQADQEAERQEERESETKGGREHGRWRRRRAA